MALVTQSFIAPGSRIRVLVVDDSVVIRRVITLALQDDPQIEVVGIAQNGSIALSRIEQLNPDVVTLDIEMPDVDGLETLRTLRKKGAGPRVIMFSTLTERGASATFEALALGAHDYVTKPANSGSLDVSLRVLKAELLPKIKQFFRFEKSAQPPKPPASPVCFPAAGSGSRRVLLIGVSTGGPNALCELLPSLPKDFPLPVLVVQHMPPLFTRLLADRLRGLSNLDVCEAVHGQHVQAGRILIAPGDYHMKLNGSVTDARVFLDQSPMENSCRPAVDVLFRSAQQIYGGKAIAVILTGMGSDGLRGVRGLKAEGGFVIAQDEASSVVWGMPGSVVNEGLADQVLPLAKIGPEIVREAYGAAR